MFERRLMTVLLVLLGFTILLVLRAAQVQVVDKRYWAQAAQELLSQHELLETTRGRILDYAGRELAVDDPCIDACVDYRAITYEPDAAWVRTLALDRLRRRGSDYTQAPASQRRAMLDAEIQRVKSDIRSMWDRLAQVSGESPQQIEETRQSIIQRVEMLRRYIWYDRYVQATRRHENRQPDPWYRRWLIDDAADGPQLDQFEVAIAEQQEAHPILRHISMDVNNLLGKQIDRYPGLELRGGRYRYYPYAQSACHVIGRLAPVTRQDLDSGTAAADQGDPLRRYLTNDLIGRTGIEALCEQALRGFRGRIDQIGGDGGAIVSRLAPVPGQDVRLSIDIELQREIEDSFRNARILYPPRDFVQHEMHGAAVIIDVPSGEVRALVSYPVFDLNSVNDDYASLAGDLINLPLLDRATQAQLVPGSTAKPMVGIGAITQGVLGLHEGIECTGYLVLHGIRYSFGRCWTASEYAKTYPDLVPHHQIPFPHHGSYGNPDGFLTFSDALERSCNVFFETVGDRLGVAGLHRWFDRFGLGRKTGIGIAESAGRIPPADPSALPRSRINSTKWFSAIGQGEVAATPLQMANVAASIARHGIWIRPHLLRDQPLAPGDRVDLQLNPDAVAEAIDGMTRVVNSRAGTGIELHRDDLLIAGKTGSATASAFSIPLRGPDGQYLRDDKGRIQRQFLQIGTREHPNPQAPWYIANPGSETDLTHAWYIGFAPADHPQIAFAVLVEYGGTGGKNAAFIARDMLEACIRHGYLSLEAGAQTALESPDAAAILAGGPDSDDD